MIGARPEERLHGVDHRFDPDKPLGLTLWQQIEVSQLGSSKQLGSAVRTRGDTGTATDTHGGVHRRLGGLLRDRDQIGVGSAPGVDRDVAARLDDPIEGAPIDDQILEDGEPGGPPRLDGDHIAVTELSHVELAGSRPLLRSVGLPVDHQPARAADPFSAVVLEGDRLSVVEGEPVVDDVEHLQERGMGTDPGSGVLLESPWTIRAVLAPDAKCDIHYL